MSQKLLEAVAQNTRLKLVYVLKRADGLGVQEAADELGMSYMGVKETCLDLERRGLVEGKREPTVKGAAGRPRLIYRLTERANALFPAASNPLTLQVLEAAKRLYGAASPEKMLRAVWQEKASELAPKIHGSTLLERVRSLAVVREQEGHMPVVEESDPLRIVEHHCPFLDLLRAYPVISNFETDLFSIVLGRSVVRREVARLWTTRFEFEIE